MTARPEVTVKVTDVAGNFYGIVRTATVTAIELPLNGIDHCDLTFHATDPTAGLLLGRVGASPTGAVLGVLHRELEVWVNGVRVLVGPCPVIEIDAGGVCKGTIYGFPWWLFQRVVGRADRTNLLVNGGFESSPDFTGWDVTTVTEAIETVIVYTGTKSAKLTGSGTSMKQAFSFTHAIPTGLEPRFTAAFYLATGAAVPLNDIYVTVEANDNPGALTVIDYDAATVVRDNWVLINFGLGRKLAPNVARTVTLSLRSAANGIYWDGVFAGQPESIGAPPAGGDPVAVAKLLVEYMQDPAHGKDNLNILTATTATAGKTYTVWQDADHEEFGRALAQLTGISGGIDWWATYGNRTMNFAATRGTLKPQHKLRSGKTLTNYRVRVDGTGVAKSAIVIGVGSDFTRDEGGHIATSTLPVMELVEHAPVSMPVREYDLWAKELATQNSRASETVEGAGTNWGLDLIGSIVPGDSVPVQVTVGQYEMAPTDMRILHLKIDLERGRLVPTLAVVP